MLKLCPGRSRNRMSLSGEHACILTESSLRSLLPAPMHIKVARHCIAHGKHLVTASYISPEMKELSDQ